MHDLPQYFTRPEEAKAFAGLALSFGFSAKLTAKPPLGAKMVKQVHGIRVVEASMIGDQVVEADGLFTTKKNECIAVKTADCLPVLVASSDGKFLAVMHAGWRGLCAGILTKGVACYVGRASSLCAIVGPAISRENYEVGLDVAEAIAGPSLGLSPEQAQQCLIKRDVPGKWLADLKLAAFFSLRNLGLKAENIGVYQTCTQQNSDLWYSYRRDKVASPSNITWAYLK